MVLVATDRISAFDHILPRAIPCKGQVLNLTSAHFLEATQDIVPNFVISVPDPNVTIGLRCDAIPIEMVVRGYLCGHAWREYEAGKREICGVPLPDGLKRYQKLPEPIITPATKSAIGHDEDISEREILKSRLVDDEVWMTMKHYSLALFEKGTEMAAERGLILADTKYEFGMHDDKVYLIDEIHTPDSSRYFYQEGYAERQAKNEPQKQLSKEFVRQWLIANDFQGLDGQVMPEMPDDFLTSVTDRYIELYEHITGRAFEKASEENMEKRVFENIFVALKKLGMPETGASDSVSGQ